MMNPSRLAPHAPVPRRHLLLLLALALVLPGEASSQPLGVPPVPPRRVETVPPRPATDRLVWQPGSWQWDAAGERYTWRTGRHIIRRQGTTRFVPGRWTRSGGQWLWRDARWR